MRRTDGAGQDRIDPTSFTCPFAHVMCLSFYANDLPQRVRDLDQIALRVPYILDGLVASRRFINHIFILTAFDARRRLLVIGGGKTTLRFVAGHGAARPMTATVEALVVAQAAHDVRTRSHRSGDD